jgi:integrase
MAVFVRPDSPYYWMWLEVSGRPGLRENTRVPVDGGTEQQTKDNRKLAQAIYAARMGDLARERHRLPTVTQRSFGEHATWYAEHVSAHKRSVLRELSILKQLRARFDPLALSAITRETVLEWRTARVHQVAPGTVNREHAVLRHLLGTAVSQYLQVNPAAQIRRLRVPEQDVRILTPKEEARLLEAASGELRVLIILALDTLLRLSSAVALRREQDHGSYLTVLNPKTRGYEVPVSRRLRKALDTVPAKSGWMFPSFQGGSALRRGRRVYEAFCEACRRARIPLGRATGGLTFHALRHTGASRMLAAGVDVQTVRELGGWSSLVMLQRYLHPTAAHKRAAVEAVSHSRQAPVRPAPRRNRPKSAR